jgi:DNA helicase HerA-like ATPase
MPNEYEVHGLGMQAPYLGSPRNIGRQVDLMYNRLRDDRYAFLLNPGANYTPNGAGETISDLDDLLTNWVGHDRPVTVLDLSGAGADVLATVTGTVLRILSDALYWAGDLGVGSRKQPLLIVLEEAHLFVRAGESSAAHRAVEQIAKEGRKYGVGLMLVSQRPTDLDSSALSQCGTLISLRLTNQADRSRVAAAMPDDLADLVNLLPALRTGEAIVTGEAVKVPTRVRIRAARHKPVGSDPDLATGWRMGTRPRAGLYAEAVRAWRLQQVASAEERLET